MSRDYDEPLILDLQVGDSEEFTGLLNHNGNKIFKARQPIGFGRDKEWLKNSYRLLKS